MNESSNVPIFEEFEKHGVTIVKTKLAEGLYGEKQKPLAKEWVKQKLEEREKVDKAFQNYRAAGVGVSVSLLSISLALLIWVKRDTTLSLYLDVIHFMQVFALFITIIASLCIQCFNYLGYQIVARSLISNLKEQPILKDQNFLGYKRIVLWVNKQTYNDWFTLGDQSFWWATTSFFFGAAFAAFLLIVQ